MTWFDKQRQRLGPVYVFDPLGVYGDPDVQAWATYYADGGRNLAGSSHFIAIPGLTDQPASTEPADTEEHLFDASSPQPPSPSLSWNIFGNAREPLSSHQSVASGSQSHPMPPKGPRRKQSRTKVKKGVLGLLEILHLTRRSRSAPPRTPPRPSTPPIPISSPMDMSSELTLLERSTSRHQAQIPNYIGNILGSHEYPPTYAESLYERPTATAFVSTVKTSFSPSVSFGEIIEGDSSRPLPQPDIQLPHEKAPSYESHSFIVGRVEEDVMQDVPQRLSRIEEKISPGRVKSLYHNLMSLLLMEVAPVNNATTNSILDTLNEYAESLRSFDSVTSLVRCHVYRGSLLQVASALGISDDPRVRRALQEDETDIAEILNRVSFSDSDIAAVGALEGDDAQSFLNVVQDVLDRGFLLRDPTESTQARRLLVKLSARCYKLPDKLFIEGVVRSETHATFGGGFGDVFRGTYKNEVVALKSMRIFQRDADLASKRKKFCREALTWQSLKHAYVVPFLGIVAEDFPDVFCMVSPWMRHGTVLKHLEDNGREGVNKRLYEIAQGLEYLHSQHIVHGDLRGSNILINDDWQACLTDFGLAVLNDSTPATCTSRHEGSVRWMAPELYAPEQFGMEHFRRTPASDIYAFACTCLELYTGQPPFHDLFYDPGIVIKVSQGSCPHRPTDTDPPVSDDLWRLVEACWSQKYLDRPEVKSVVKTMKELSHPPLQPLPLSERCVMSPELRVIVPSPNRLFFESDLANTSGTEGSPLPLSAEMARSIILERNDRDLRRVHFALPFARGLPTDSPHDRRTAAVSRRRKELYDEAVSTRSIGQRPLPETPTKSSVHNADTMSWAESTYPWGSSNADTTDTWESSSTTDSWAFSDSEYGFAGCSSSSSLFDPELLVSPRKEHPKYSFERFTNPPVESMPEAPLQDSKIPDYFRFDYVFLGADETMFSLSCIAEAVRSNVPRGVCLLKGKYYNDSFTSDDLVTTIQAQLFLNHSPTDEPLPFASLASDIAWSLRSQSFVASAEPDTERLLNNVYFFSKEDDTESDPPTGVIPMLTWCYSPSCSSLTPCYSFSCPRWGQLQTTPTRVRITNPDPLVTSKIEVPLLLPSKPELRPELLASCHDLADAIDFAFNNEFKVPDFAPALKEQVELVARTHDAPGARSWGLSFSPQCGAKVITLILFAFLYFAVLCTS